MFHITQWKALKFMLTFFLLTASMAFAIDPSGSITLDGIKMNVIKTADNGVVNHETIFYFSQKDGVVSAEYKGGKILKGFLVGKFPTQNQLEFSYCQMQIDGKLDNGMSTCQLSRNKEGKITLTEHFEWKSRPGEFGTNVFQEL
jgi:hypothetical protein